MWFSGQQRASRTVFIIFLKDYYYCLSCRGDNPYSCKEMSLRVTDVLNKYSGDGDVTVRLKQAHLAKSLLKLKELAVVIPLFLDSPAFAVYDQLSDAEKQDANKIEVALRTAFAADKFLAYDEFRKRVWRNGKTVDVFLADLKRLAHLENI